MKDVEQTLKKCTDKLGNTALHHVVGVYGFVHRYPEALYVPNVIDFLLDKKAADINAQNNCGHTPLHVARSPQAFNACLQRAVCSDEKGFTVKDKRGRNFWHLLCETPHKDSVEVLLATRRMNRKVPAGIDAEDDLGRTPLHYAAMDNSSLWLADSVANVVPSCINVQDKFGRTPLHYAALDLDSFSQQMPRRLLEQTTYYALKTRRSADDTIRDSFSMTCEDYVNYLQTYYYMSCESVSMLKIWEMMSDNYYKHVYDQFLPRRQVYTGRMTCDRLVHELEQQLSRSCNSVISVWNIWKQSHFDYTRPMVRKSVISAENETQQPSIQSKNISSLIGDHIWKAMLYLADELAKLDGRLKCDVVPVGSSVDGTKSHFCDEFDYMFVLTELGNNCQVVSSQENPPGFVQLKAADGKTLDEDCVTDDGTVDTRAIRFIFEQTVLQILSTSEFQSETHLEYFRSNKGRGLSPLVANDAYFEHPLSRNSTNVILRFPFPVSDCHIAHAISVDIVPAIRVNNWWPEDANPDIDKASGCHFVFSQPQKLYPRPCWTKPHALISFAVAECDIIRQSPSVVKAAYVVVKCMTKMVRNRRYFSSYVIKTAVLHCMAEEDLSSRANGEEVDEEELKRWVRIILRRLLHFVEQDFVPSFFMPQCHLRVWKFEHYTTYSYDLLRRYDLRYEDFFSPKFAKFVNSGSYNGSPLQHVMEALVWSHIMYWSVLPESEEIKSLFSSISGP